MEATRFFVGAFFFAAMIAISVWVQPLNIWLFGVPAVLMGIDPRKLLNGRLNGERR